MSLPPSSPRLPSPPPPTEIQIGPKSPSIQDSSNNLENAMEQSIIDSNSSRRIHPGTKGADMAAGPPLVPLMEVKKFALLHVRCDTNKTVARFCLPVTRAPKSLTLPPYPTIGIHYRPYKSANRVSAGYTSLWGRSCAVAVRALPIPHKQVQRSHCWLSIRHTSMLSIHLPRDASFGMAVSMRRS